MKWFRATLFLVFLFSAEISAKEEGTGGSAGVVYHEGEHSLSLNVSAQPIVEVLAELARQSGIRVFIEPEVAFRVSAEYEHRGVARALQSLLKDRNYILIYEDSVVGAGGPKYRVIELRVFAPGSQRNELLVPVSELLASDAQRQGQAQRELENRARDERKNSPEERLKKLEKRIVRVKELRDKSPDRYSKVVSNLRKRYPEFGEEIDVLLAQD